jgi:hypothetical protein
MKIQPLGILFTTVFAVVVVVVKSSNCLNGPCAPGNEQCGAPFENAPVYHLMNQHGCGENDPNV